MEEEPTNINEIEEQKPALEKPPHVHSPEEQPALDEEFTVHEVHKPHPEIDAEQQAIFRRFEIQAQNESERKEPDAIDTAITEAREATSSPSTSGILHKLGVLNPLKHIFALGTIKNILGNNEKTSGEKTEEVVGEVVNVAVPIIGGPIYQAGLGVLKGIFGPSPEEKAKQTEAKNKAYLESISIAVPQELESAAPAE
jgi:hypothetical protein